MYDCIVAIFSCLVHVCGCDVLKYIVLSFFFSVFLCIKMVHLNKNPFLFQQPIFPEPLWVTLVPKSLPLAIMWQYFIPGQIPFMAAKRQHQSMESWTCFCVMLVLNFNLPCMYFVKFISITWPLRSKGVSEL